MLMNLIGNMYLEITIWKSLLHLPEANELKDDGIIKIYWKTSMSCRSLINQHVFGDYTSKIITTSSSRGASGLKDDDIIKIYWKTYYLYEW